MVEVEDLLPEMEILDQRRPARTDFQRVLIVGNRSTLGCGQNSRFARCGLMKFATFAAVELLIVDNCRPARCAVRFRGLGHFAILA